MKWPPDVSNLEMAYGYDEFEKKFLIFCKHNNFKYEEISYLLCMMNTFCFLNNVDKKENNEN